MPSLNLANFNHYKINARRILDAKLVECALDTHPEQAEGTTVVGQA